MKKIFFILFRIFNFLLRKIPYNAAISISGFLFIVIYYIVRYRRKVVIQNLQSSFPEKSVKEINIIARKFYKHLCETIIETILLYKMKASKMDEICTYKNIEVLQNIYDKGKSIIGVVGHYGNWEYLTGLQLHTKFQVIGLYKPLHNPFFDKFIFEIRNQFGMEPVPLKKTLKRLIEYQREKIQTLMVIVGDQTPAKGEINYWTTFLNQDTPIYLGAEKLAKKLDHVVVFIHVKKMKRGYYQINFELVEDKAPNTEPFGITDRHLKLLENDIVKQPEYWLWSHKRWKHKRNINL